MDRDLLLWQVRWLVYHYSLNRVWWIITDPLWAAYERALESGEWTEYAAMHAAANA